MTCSGQRTLDVNVDHSPAKQRRVRRAVHLAAAGEIPRAVKFLESVCLGKDSTQPELVRRLKVRAGFKNVVYLGNFSLATGPNAVVVGEVVVPVVLSEHGFEFFWCEVGAHGVWVISSPRVRRRWRRGCFG